MSCRYNACVMSVRRSMVVQVRVSPEERGRIWELAGLAGVRPSEWIRARALEEASGRMAPSDSRGGSAQVSPVVPSAPPRAPEPEYASEAMCDCPTPESIYEGRDRHLHCGLCDGRVDARLAVERR